jgi:hypothetical protein
MAKILREHEIATVFRKAARGAKDAVVAVPFWGRGAVKALGLTQKLRIRVICNLDQSACNPHVIDEIRRLGIKVCTNPRLHAKIYATPELAIVGSSNVSTNGMTVEGAAAKGWIEANVASTDATFIADVQALFEEIWDLPETTRVRAADIKAALANRPPPPAPLLRSKTLLAACRENPQAFASVYVVPYNKDLSKTAGQRLATMKKEASPPVPGIDASDFRRALGYQFLDLPNDAWLIGLDCRRTGRRMFAGCSRTTGLRFQIDGEDDLFIVLPGVVRLNGRRLPVAAAEKDALALVAAKLSGITPLPKVVRLIDRAK